MTNKCFNVINLGCRVNLFESTAIIDLMIKAGFKYTRDIKKASIFIINTCTVTMRADRKCRNLISRINKLPNKKVLVLVGCFSQINVEFASQNAEIVLGNKFKSKIPEYVMQYNKEHARIIKVIDISKERSFEDFGEHAFCENTRPTIKIQDGCDLMCSYCLIPFARGRKRSLGHTKALSTIANLVKKGFYEIILTGINLVAYDDNGYTFYDLLKDINNLKGNFRIRVSSVEPFNFSYKIADIMTANPNRFVQDYHICLQNANNDVLKSMNRKYTVKDFAALVKYIKSKNPYASITTDYIVGYKSETEQRHKDSLKNLDQMKLSFVNIFPYSERPKTVGSRIKSEVSDIDKSRRVKEVTLLCNKNTRKYLNKFINKIVTVYFEQSKEKDFQVGHSQYFFRVYVKTKKNLHTQVHDVKVIKIDKDNRVIGKLVK